MTITTDNLVLSVVNDNVFATFVKADDSNTKL